MIPTSVKGRTGATSNARCWQFGLNARLGRWPDSPVAARMPRPQRSANTKELPEGVEKQEQLASGAIQGRNDFRRIGYGGPCPPPGTPHRYHFKLYALDTKLTLKTGATKPELERAMKSHILGKTELMGRYGR